MIMGWQVLGRATRIGRKLVLLSVAFSSALAFVITAIQLVQDYRQQRADLEMLLEEVRVFLPPMAASVWTFNEKQISLALDAIVSLPRIDKATIRTTTGTNVWSAAHGESKHVIVRSYPLQHLVRGTEQEIATIEVVAGLDELYNRLISQALGVLAGNVLKALLVSAFMFALFRRLVTKRLEALADNVSGLVPQLIFTSVPQQPAPDPSEERDEIDSLQWAFDRMEEQLRAAIESLQEAYDDVRKVNHELENDIVARIKAEEEVRQLNAELDNRVRQRTAELEAANSELGAFAYSVSHDLRAPLRRIEGFGRMLCEDYTDRLDERGIHYLNRIRAGTERMGEMIDSFLKLSRSTRGDLNVETVDLSQLAHAVVEGLREKEHDRTVEVEIQPGVQVRGDKRLLELVLDNLLGNAWKYTRQREVARIRFGMTPCEGGSAVFVADNGAGFDMSYAQNLFVPFHRLHAAEQFDGIGIGLATVQRVIARHGGKVWGEGVPDGGATFYFTCGPQS